MRTQRDPARVERHRVQPGADAIALEDHRGGGPRSPRLGRGLGWPANVEGAGSDLAAVVGACARAVAGPHDPAVTARCQSVAVAAIAPGRLEPVARFRWPCAQDLASCAVELEVVVAG